MGALVLSGPEGNNVHGNRDTGRFAARYRTDAATQHRFRFLEVEDY